LCVTDSSNLSDPTRSIVVSKVLTTVMLSVFVRHTKKTKVIKVNFAEENTRPCLEIPIGLKSCQAFTVFNAHSLTLFA
jgi:hypothetical protein